VAAVVAVKAAVVTAAAAAAVAVKAAAATAAAVATSTDLKRVLIYPDQKRPLKRPFFILVFQDAKPL
jgi:hypothetical protein